jgi:hypothetical protein
MSKTNGRTRTGTRKTPTTRGAKEMKPKFIIFPEINTKKPVMTTPTEIAVIFSESFGNAKQIHLTIAEI